MVRDRCFEGKAVGRIGMMVVGWLWLISLPALAAGSEERYRPWALSYAADTPLDALAPYNLLVLDADSHPPLEPLISRGKQLLGYLSLGEAGDIRAYTPLLERFGILLGENPNWKGSRYIDIRDPRWTALVVEELIPGLLRQGFRGVFLDTLDSPLYLEEQADPARFKGMHAAAARLVRTIRRHYPDILIMVNRAFPLLPEIGDQIDMLLAESLRSGYDFATKTYRMQSERDYTDILGQIRAARARRPALAVMTLDYWQPEDAATIRSLYALERANGFLPYVAAISLDAVHPEPPP